MSPAGDDVDHRASDGGPTLGEISRRLSDVAVQIRDLKLDLSKTYVRQDVYESDRRGDGIEMGTVLARVDAIEQGKKWGVRTIVSSVAAVAATLATTVLALKFGVSG